MQTILITDNQQSIANCEFTPCCKVLQSRLAKLMLENPTSIALHITSACTSNRLARLLGIARHELKSSYAWLSDCDIEQIQEVFLFCEDLEPTKEVGLLVK